MFAQFKNYLPKIDRKMHFIRDFPENVDVFNLLIFSFVVKLIGKFIIKCGIMHSGGFYDIYKRIIGR